MGLPTKDFYLADLNAEQRKVALHVDGPAVVFAGPGSGKTRTLIANILHRLVAGHVDPAKIVVTTFTQKAANEIKERLDQATKHDKRWHEVVQGLQVGTIHSFCLTLLRKHGFGNLSGCTNLINFDENDILLFLCVHAYDLGLSFDEFKSASEAFGALSRSKKDKRPVSYEGFLSRLAAMFSMLSEGLHDQTALNSIKNSSEEGAFVLECYGRYLQLTAELGVLDHSLILKRTHDLLVEHENALRAAQDDYHSFLIDEFQDTNRIQDRIFSRLAAKGENILVVGDEDQSIYGFRGARVELFRTFAARWEGKKKVAEHILTGNYRSARAIITHFNEFKIKAFQNSDGTSLKLSTPVLDEHGIVTKVTRETPDLLAESVLQKIRNLIRSKSITSLRSIGILYRSDVGDTGQFLKALRELVESRFRDIPISFGSDGKMLKSEQVRVFLEAIALIADALAPPTKARKGVAKFIQEAAKQLLKSNDCTELFGWLKKQEEEKSQVYIHRILSYLLKWQPFVSSIPNGTDSVTPSALTLYLAKLTEEAARFDRLSRKRHYTAARTIRSFLRYLQEADHAIAQDQLPEAVSVLTMHKAKGLEWPIVFIIAPDRALFESRIPEHPFDVLRARIMCGEEWERHLPALETGEGARLLYVAQSRARSILAYGINEATEPPGMLSSTLSELQEWGAISEKLSVFPAPDTKHVITTSHSDLISLSGCALRYSLERQFGFEGRPLPQLYEGISMHRCVQILHEQKAQGYLPSDEELEKIFDQSWIPYGQSGKRAEKRRQQLKDYFLRYAGSTNERLAGFKILGVERELRRQIEMRGEVILLQGRADLILEDVRSREISLVEVKLDSDGDETSDADLQLSTYQYMLDLEQARRVLYFLKNGRVVPLEMVTLEECKRRIEQLSERLIQFSSEARFPPTDTRETCSRCNLKDFCVASQVAEILKENPKNIRKIG